MATTTQASSSESAANHSAPSSESQNTALAPRVATEKTGILLVNLGTPDSTAVADVRTYLREFLNDPRVLDINPVVRWFLLNLIILRTRPAASAEAYKKVWTQRGSPLLCHSEDLLEKVHEHFPDVTFALGMRYGNPSMASAMDKLHAAQVDRVIIVPLYPQYASSSTGTALEMAYKLASERWNVPNIQVLPPFYREPAFLDAWGAIFKRYTAEFKPDYVLFSYHGLPVRHVVKSDPTGKHCQKRNDCCDKICHANTHCYRAQCYETTRLLIDRFGLTPDNHSVSFQSRLGKDPWITPYTDVVLEELAHKGIKRLAVICPAFVADCLETLEEIAMEGKEEFVAAGGEDLLLVPSLNSEPEWVDALAAMLRRF